MPTKNGRKERATYLSQKGSNTALILRGDRVTLAHADQIRSRGEKADWTTLNTTNSQSMTTTTSNEFETNPDQDTVANTSDGKHDVTKTTITNDKECHQDAKSITSDSCRLGISRYPVRVNRGVPPQRFVPCD